MFGSVDSLSMISLPHLTDPEEEDETIMRLDCWWQVRLSKTWVPSHLLANRRQPSNSAASQGVFRTLEKRGHAQRIESFSVYSDSDNESDTNGLSDSDDDFNLDSINSVNINTKENSLGFFENATPVSKLKTLLSCEEEKKVQPSISLHEILKSTAEVDIRNFEIEMNRKDKCEEVENFKTNKKNKKDKKTKKNKIAKSVALDKFLEDYTEEDRQEQYANDYLAKLLMDQNTDNVQIKNNYDFPDLSAKERKFVHSETPIAEKSEMSFKTLTGNFCQPDITENDITNDVETAAPQPEPEIGKIVIENIPSDVSHSDIFSILCGYGEIKDFSLEPDGAFSKAVVEICAEYAIDWIIECLDGTHAFGASSKVLKCYGL